MNKDLKNYTLDELTAMADELGIKKFQAKYIFTFIHEKNVSSIDEITTLSKIIRSKLTENGYFIGKLKLVETFIDPDGTIKYLFETHDNKRFETVLLDDDGRKTLCISTQIGCKMNCSFCATAKLNLDRDLSTSEILDQVLSVSADNKKISNVVYMGMGEPLDNFDNVAKSLLILNSPDGLNIGARHLTVSTCGIPDKIEDLADLNMQCRLAISIHAADDDLRNRIMPVNRTYPLKDIFQALRGYQRKTNRRITFEYCLIKGVNDGDHNAKNLIKWVKNTKCNVNLIEYNTHPGCAFEASSRNTIKKFQQLLENAGVTTHLRFKKGHEIKAACGQLGADWLKPEE